MIKEILAQALKNHIAILGKTGSGKSSTEKLLVETAVADGFRVCVLDSIKSDWWGITSSASGKAAGLPFQILGGPHGHVPLNSSAGKVIGQLVGTGKLPLSIIDMADFEAGGLQRFFIEFAQSLMRNAKGVVYLIIEEAHEFAPKERSGIGAENLAIHWAKKLATAGRSKGIRLIVATQRIQALHNAVLGSCETLIAHRLSAPADQEPVTRWLKANTDKPTVEKVMSSLSSLPTGTGWLCSGEGKVFEMVKFPKFKTYDNAATPIGDSEEISIKTAPVDQEALRAIIGDAVVEAEANDPAKLKARIRELEKHGARVLPKPEHRADPRAEQLAWADGHASGYRQAVSDYQTAFDCARAEFATKIFDQVSGFKFAAPKARPAKSGIPQPHTPAVVTPTRVPPTSRPMVASGDRSRPEQRIIDSLFFWAGIGKATPTRQQVAAVAGYSPRSSGYRNLLSAMSTKGLITYPSAGMLALADPSQARAIDAETAKQALMNTLTVPQRRIVEAFNGTQATRPEIAQRSGYSAASSGYRNLISSLSSIGVVVYPSTGMLDLADWVRDIL